MASSGAVDIITATRDVEAAMVRVACEKLGGEPGELSFEQRGPLRARTLAQTVFPQRPPDAPHVLFFYSIYPDTVSDYLHGAECAPVGDVYRDIESVMMRFQPPAASFALVNVFRHVSEARDRAPLSDPTGLRARIRQFNREALRVAQTGRAVLIDLDDAMAREGARSLGIDHSCEGSERALECGAMQIAESLRVVWPRRFAYRQ